MRTFRVGFTGGIACGKTRASSYLKDIGVPVIDADLLGHRAYLPGTSGFEKVVGAFGDSVVNPATGTIDRAKLGAIVFANPSEMKRLTEIVWPEIQSLTELEIGKIESQSPQPIALIIEAAVMIEAGWQKRLDSLWVFKVPPEIAKQRLIARSSLSPEEAEKRISSQLPNEEREKYADIVIDTNRDPFETKEIVLDEWKKLTDRLSKRTT